MPSKIDISKYSLEEILSIQNQLAKRAKQLSKAKKIQQKPKRIIPDDVDDDWDPYAMTPAAKAKADREKQADIEKQKRIKADYQNRLRKKQQEDEEYGEYFKTLVYDNDEMKAVQSARAFHGAHQLFTIKPIEKNMYSYSNFLNEIKPEIRRVLESKIDELRGLKVELSYNGYFQIWNWIIKTPQRK